MHARRFLTKRTHHRSHHSKTPVSYTFPSLLDYVAPTTSQPCSYFNDLQSQFANALIEVQGIHITFDSTPQQIEDSFSDMQNNFTDYNFNSKNDQLEQQILDDTQTIIDKAPFIVTLSQKNSYLTNLQAGLDKVNFYYNNYACNFNARIRLVGSQNYLCVGGDTQVTSTPSDLLLDNCDQL